MSLTKRFGHGSEAISRQYFMVALSPSFQDGKIAIGLRLLTNNPLQIDARSR